MALTQYETKIIEEIALHNVEPNQVSKLFALAGKPMEKVLEAARNSKIRALHKVGNIVQSSVEKAITLTIKLARYATSDKSVLTKYRDIGCNIHCHSDIRCQSVDLLHRDTVADRFKRSNAVIVASEGALMGVATTVAEGFPLAQASIPAVVAADVTASMILLSRHVCQVACAYGYSPTTPPNIPHILAAMVPHTDSSDEGYLTVKAGAIEELRSAGRHVAKQGGRLFGRKAMEKGAPRLITLINKVAERLGHVITQKELGMLVPFAGACLNGGVNLAFQRAGHIAAKDYFRTLVLTEKYAPTHGSNYIDDLIRSRVEELRDKTGPV